MPSGAGVIRYAGKRGVVWYVKFVDGDGKQVKERVGSEAEGCNRKKAGEELRARLVAVQRDGYRKPEPLTLAGFAERFLTDHLPGRNVKTSTRIDYEATIRRHLLPALGTVELTELERRPEVVERYIVGKLADGLSPKTVRNHLSLLGRMFRVAIRWRLAASNPVDLIEPPRAEQTEVEVLSEVEIARLLSAYRELEAEADEETAPWWALARRLVTVAVGTGCRRGELLGLRWGEVSMLDASVTVRRAWVRNEMTSPKSRTSRRAIPLKPDGVIVAALHEQWQASRYRADDSLVFCHPALGTPLDPSKVSRVFMRPALVRAGIVKPFRTWHGLRHTALTHEAAVNPQAYVQMRAGHSQGSITERYIHAAQVAFPGAAERGEDRIFGAVVPGPVPSSVPTEAAAAEVENGNSPLAGAS
jgi:integrase